MVLAFGIGFALVVLAVPAVALAQSLEPLSEVGSLTVIEQWTVGSIAGDYGSMLIVKITKLQGRSGEKYQVDFVIPATERFKTTRSASIQMDALPATLDAVQEMMQRQPVLAKENHESISLQYSATKDIHIVLTQEGRRQYAAVMVESEVVFLKADSGLARLAELLENASKRVAAMQVGA